MKTMKMALAMAMAVGLTAAAQPTAVRQASEDGVEMQVGATLMNVKQVKDDLFAGTEKFAAGASDVAEINLDPKMMGMVNGKGDSELAHKMKFMVIHTYTYPKEGMYKMEDVEVYRKKLQDGSWSCSIHVKDKDGTTDICSRTSPDNEGSEMVILAAEPKELTFIHMSGNMSMDELGKMGGMGGLNRRTPTPPKPPAAAPAPAAPPAAPAPPR